MYLLLDFTTQKVNRHSLHKTIIPIHPSPRSKQDHQKTENLI